MRVLLVASLIALVAQIGAFVYFGNSSYRTKMNTEFLSLDSSAGVCEPVTLSKTQAYYLDKYGTWDQAITFKSQEALFVVEFTGYRGDTASWAADMDALYNVINTELKYLRSISNLPIKILHLISWRKTIQATISGSIRIWFNADPAYIFNIPGAQLNSNMGKTGDGCAESTSWSMDNGVLKLTFDNVWNGSYTGDGAADISRSWTCANFDIKENGFDVQVNRNMFRSLFIS